MADDTAYRKAMEVYQLAAIEVSKTAERLIADTIAEAFPDVTEVLVTGEYNEDLEIRLEFHCPDGIDEVAWETIIEGVEEVTFDLVATTGEDWDGTNTLYVTA